MVEKKLFIHDHPQDAPFFNKVRTSDGTLVCECWPIENATEGETAEAVCFALNLLNETVDE